ncbi:hypothetical protein HYQ33_gp117 [Salmonella phage aagejoakim]|uniref:Uncharacterized protein n=1 Tax=Salmonella phage aagejoakim TaxID=2713273 RepID=A0A6G8RNA1_9CAUD|nr:hypothetical protein HYQ33_gp117 [Salmonella phage aagejoakim]QIO02715.1 hypothetical protein aagejoakim_117 [Salmonella phage aagejoakim]
MKKYVRLNTVLESVIEYFIMQHLRAENDHVDDELLIANIEHALWDEVLDQYVQPKFTQIELSAMWSPETVFNIDIQS